MEPKQQKAGKAGEAGAGPAAGPGGGAGGSPSTGPVGQGNHPVRQGEDVESIAFEKQLPWREIWDDPKNAEVKRVRKDWNILLPGDRLEVREKREKEEPGATEQLHPFRLEGRPQEINIIVKEGDIPRADEPYVLTIDRRNYEGKTDSKGRVHETIMPNASIGHLLIGEEMHYASFPLDLGYLDPITEISGVQGRLLNLGFYDREPDGVMSKGLTAAIRAYQEWLGEEPTGKLDQATRDALLRDHGC